MNTMIGVSSSWLKTVSDIDAKDWESVFPDELLYSKKLFRVMELSFPNLNYTYLHVKKDDRTLIIIPCFTYNLQLDVVANQNVQKFANKVRRRYNRFLSVKVFVIGSYIATCENYIITNDTVIPYKEHIQLEIENLARLRKCKLIMIKEVPSAQLQQVHKLLPKFTFVDSLPNCHVPVLNSFQPYPSLLKTKARQRYKKALRDFNNNKLRFEIIHNFSESAEQAYRLYQNVLDKSNSKFEALNVDFFKNLNSFFTDNIYLLTVKNEEDELKCIELIFECNHKLIPIYIGIDYSYKDVKCLYFNTINKAILMAEEKGLDYVVLGQNNYLPKVRSGALISRGFLGFYSTSKFYSLLIKKVFRYLFPEFKNTYGIMYIAKANEFITKFVKKYSIDVTLDQRPKP